VVSSSTTNMSEQMILIPTNEYEQLLQKSIAASKTIATVELKDPTKSYINEQPKSEEGAFQAPDGVIPVSTSKTIGTVDSELKDPTKSYINEQPKSEEGETSPTLTSILSPVGEATHEMTVLKEIKVSINKPKSWVKWLSACRFIQPKNKRRKRYKNKRL